MGLAKKNVYLWRVDAGRCPRLRSGALGGFGWPVGSAGSWNCGYSPLRLRRGNRGSRSVGELKGMSQTYNGLTFLVFLRRIIFRRKAKRGFFKFRKSNKN